jgi:hypothetical protein
LPIETQEFPFLDPKKPQSRYVRTLYFLLIVRTNSPCW